MPADNHFAGDAGMKCEEFATAGLDLGSEGIDNPLQQAAREHMRNCTHCEALHENWQALRADLRLLGRESRDAEAPSRVEMRLRQDFRTKHTTMKTRRAAVAATWALAAAAVLVVTLSWVHWRGEKNNIAAIHSSGTAITSNRGNVPDLQADPSTDIGETIVASNDSGDFTLLPGSVPSSMEGAMVVHVEMQRAALGALGLTVNEEHAADLIQVDLLVGDDGQPQAVRLPQSSN